MFFIIYRNIAIFLEERKKKALERRISQTNREKHDFT